MAACRAPGALRGTIRLQFVARIMSLLPSGTLPKPPSPSPEVLCSAAWLHTAPVACGVRDGTGNYLYRNAVHLAAFGRQGPAGWTLLGENPVASSSEQGNLPAGCPGCARIGLLAGADQAGWLAARFALTGQDPPLVAEVAIDATPLSNALEELRQSEARWRSLVEHVPDFVMTLQHDGRILFINRTLPPRTPAQVVGMTVYDFAAPEYHHMIRECLEWVFRTQQAEGFEVVGPGVGEPACYRAKLAPILADGKVIAAIMVATDITREKRVEELLRRTHHELEVRVRDRTASLQQTNERLQEEVHHRQQVEEALRTKQRLLNHLLEAAERERKLVAYEVHDGIVQYVAAALMHLEVFADGNTQLARAEEFHLAMNLLRTTLEESRRLISGLRPMILDELGIVAAIEYLAAEAETPPVRFEHRLTTARFASLVEGAIFRICQEAVTNARRHSRASEICITLEERDGFVRLHVEDNGCGFDPVAVRQRTFGLDGVVQRARLLGGRATIDSAPGCGTRIHVELPCEGAP